MTKEQAAILAIARRVIASDEFRNLIEYCDQHRSCDACILNKTGICRFLGAPWNMKTWQDKVWLISEITDTSVQNDKSLEQRARERRQKMLNAYFNRNKEIKDEQI